MIAAVVFAVISLAVGFLLGGCAGRDEISQSLLQRNAQLENEIVAQHNTTTGLTAALILTACGLAASLVWRNTKGGVRGSATKRKQTPP